MNIYSRKVCAIASSDDTSDEGTLPPPGCTHTLGKIKCSFWQRFIDIVQLWRPHFHNRTCAQRWSGLCNAFNFHYSARLQSLSIILALTVEWINWCIWQGQLLPYVVLTAGFDIGNLSTSPSVNRSSGRDGWVNRLRPLQTFSPDSRFPGRVTDMLNQSGPMHTPLSQPTDTHWYTH